VCRDRGQILNADEIGLPLDFHHGIEAQDGDGSATPLAAQRGDHHIIQAFQQLALQHDEVRQALPAFRIGIG